MKGHQDGLLGVLQRRSTYGLQDKQVTFAKEFLILCATS